MSESDTNPQRYPEPHDAYQRPTGELPHAVPADAAGETTAETPAPGQPVSGQPSSGQPAPGQPVSGQPGTDQTTPMPPIWQPVQPTSAAPAAPAPQQPGTWYGAPGQGAPAHPYGQPTSGQPAPGQPGYGQPTPGQPGYGQPGYGQSTPGQPMSAVPMSGQPASGQPGGGDQPPTDGGQPVAAGSAGHGRGSRMIAGGLLALLLAVGGGVVGGLVVHATDGSSNASSSAPAPTVDRSSLSGIVASVKNSVVSIQTSDAEGSGVVFTADGFIVTNNHVVADAQNNQVQVTFADGKTAQGTVVGTDSKTDLAVVKAQGQSGLTAAKFGNSDAVQVGDTVLAIGSPLGLQGSVTAGIVSALHRTIEEEPEQQGPPQNPFQFPQQQQQQQPQQQGTNIAGAIQTDAPINPGNSGGALVNTRGEVVGINTSILTSDGGEGNIGVGFAIPSDRVNEVSQALMKGQKVSHPFIGINVGTADGGAGATVASVVSGSPAEKAGLKQNDVIVKANNDDIHSGDDLLDVVQSSKVGDKLQLTVSRNGSTSTLTVTVGESS